MDAIIRLVDGAPEEYRDELLSFAKTQAMLGVAYDSTSYYNGMKSISSLVKVKNIVADESIPLDTEVYTKIYGSMDKAVVQGDGFALGVSMFSSRNGATECGNSENLKGWYQSDGVLELYNGDQAQHDKGYWATVDPLRLPGITTNHVTQDLAGFSIKTNDRDWVGGSTAGVENYASIGQDFKSNYSDLEGKKSWFAFGDQVVALGAGIQSTEGDTVETIVENRKTDNANQLLVNGKETLARSGGDHAPFGRAAGSGLVAAPAHIRPAHADHRVWLGAADDLVIAFPVVCLGFAVFAFAAGAVAPFPAGEGVHSKMSKGVKSHLLPGKLPGRGHNGNRLVNSVHGQGFLSLGMGWLHYSQGERRCAIGRICTLWGNFVLDTPDRLCGCFLPHRRFLPAKKADKKAKFCLFKSGKSFVIMGLQQRERPARLAFMKQI
ncbi:polysaccharide lyase family 8 super-sandwich domain-containing protein [Allofournierella sp.]|uniref:polysaccharide lyase family 8 super-sandwich domain-containing protein n=1 Tax=Allofournierella sp. TaxID=1940256 RepID=UPI0039C609BB